MDPILITTFLICIIGVLFYLYLTWNFNYWKKRGVKGPEPSIVFGTLPSVVRRNRHFVFDMMDLYEKYKNCGERFIGIFMTRVPMILVLDTKLVREILVENFKCFRDNEAVLWVNRKKEELAGLNPFLAFFDDNWKEKRNEFMAGISPNKLKQAFPLFVETGNKMVAFVNERIAKGNTKIEAKSLSFKYTLDVFANFVYGIESNSFTIEDESNSLMNMSFSFVELSFQKIGLINISSIVPGWKKIFKNRFYAKETDNYFTQLQNHVLELRLRNKTDRLDYLNYLLKLQRKKNLKNLDIVAHSLTVLLDAFETSSIVIYNTLYFLTIHQEVQSKLREEILCHLDKDGQIGYGDLIHLEYLEQCINESIRLIGPIPDFSKICTQTTYLQSSENKFTKIERGTIIHISAIALHHDPEFYPDPEEFIPERFDNGMAKVMTKNGYFLPFGDGPRICSGMNLGLLEIKACIVDILKNFQLNACDETPRGKYLNRQSLSVGIDGDIFIEFKSLTNSKL